MNLDEAKSCWQSQEQLPGVAMSDGDVLELVRQRSQAFDARIRKRDRREVLAMIIGIPFFLPILLQPSWVTRAGVMLVLLGCIVIYWKLRHARANRADVNVALPLTEVLRAERAKVDAQISLLESVLWWYIAPLAIGVVVVFAGDSGIAWPTLTYAILVALLSWWIYRANRRAVNRQLRPMRDELTRLLQQIVE